MPLFDRPLFPRRKRIPPEITDGDDLESVTQQIRNALPKPKGQPVRNWLNGFVTTTAFKYLITMVAQFLAVKLGVEQGALEGLIAQLVALIMGAWGMYESSKSKVVIDGKKTDLTTETDKAAVAEVVGK